MDKRLALSGLLIAAAAAIASPTLFATALNANAALLLAGALLAFAAALLNHFRSRLQAYACAKASVEYTQNALSPTEVRVGDSVQLMGMQQKATTAKWLGRAALFAMETLNALLKALAALSALAYLAGSALFKLPDMHFIGLWVILATIAVIALSKFAGFATFLLSAVMAAMRMVQAMQGMFSGMAIGTQVISFGGSEQKALQQFMKHNKMAVITSAALSLLSWAGFAASWWLFIQAFGASAPLGGVFLVYALATMAALAPLLSKGLGLIELVGMGALYFTGVPLAASFLSIACWEVVSTAVETAAERSLKRVKR
jgi:hypothetical protein